MSFFKSLGLGAAFAVLMGAGAALAEEALRFGVAAEPYPPFAAKNSSGVWEGFEIDLSKALCEEMKAKCEIKEIAWDGIIPALTGKKIDVIFASMSITEERQKSIAFSNPYYQTGAAFIGPKGVKADLTAAGLKGKVIGVQTATIHADYIKKAHPEAEIKYYNTQDEANADMVAGRLDYVLADSVVMGDFVKTDAGKDLELKGEAPKDPIFGEGVGAGLRKEDKDLKAKIDKAIKGVMDSGAYDKIMKKYFEINVKPL